eukprot:8901602-Alexandrium_andersonii.AAC.1
MARRLCPAPRASARAAPSSRFSGASPLTRSLSQPSRPASRQPPPSSTACQRWPVRWSAFGGRARPS